MFKQRRNLIFLRDIRRKAGNLRAGLLQFFHRGLQVAFAARGQHQLTVVGGQQAGDSAAQAFARAEGTPSADELVTMYEKASGRSIRDFQYALVFATFWRGAVQIKVMRQMRERGADIPEALFVDNFPVRTLCRLLGLPHPG